MPYPHTYILPTRNWSIFMDRLSVTINYDILSLPKAPTGSQVRIDEISPKIRKTKNCNKDMLIVNSNSEYTYPKKTSKIFCGWSKVTDPITSTTGEIKVAYLGSRRSSGFELKYTIVNV